MNLCSDDCTPICDFCKYFDFNGNDQSAYVNRGYCNFHKMRKDPIDECENFSCKLIGDKK